MKVGTQHGDSDAILRAMAGFGVNHICSALPSRTFDDNWSVEGLTRLRKRVEEFGIKLDIVPLPLSSSPIERAENQPKQQSNDDLVHTTPFPMTYSAKTAIPLKLLEEK